MASLPSIGTFDFIFAPGVLCYHRTLNIVREAVDEYLRILRPGGGFCANLLPESWEMLGSCSTYIPQDFWSTLPNFCWISTEFLGFSFTAAEERHTPCGHFAVQPAHM